jgi:hypothetical protein
MGLLRPLPRLVRAHRFTSSIVTPRGYEKEVTTLVHPHALSHNPPFPPYLLPYVCKKEG